jgi:glycosyltransferase involved in cell wall biosynthesis
VRILFCNYEYPPLGGGGGVINALLAEELAHRHEVTVLTSRGLALPESDVENGVRVVRAPVFFRGAEAAASMASMLAFLPMGMRRGRRLLRSERFDVLNTHFAVPTGPVGDHLARFAAVPNVLTVHGGDLYDPSKWTSPHRHALLRLWIRSLLRRADAVVGQSRNTLENMSRYYAPGIEGERIPLGIRRPPEDGAAARGDHGFSPSDVILVTVGRLVARKGLAQLLELMEDLKRENVRLLIVGSGPQEEDLKKQASARGLDHRVRFLGRVEESEKFRILRMCDLYVSSSQHEGFGLVFLEAMACKLPVVCYDHGGQTDFLEDQRTGYLVPLNDRDRFKASCRRLISDRDARLRIGQHNLQRVEEFFIQNCARNYETLFETVVRRYQSSAVKKSARGS